MPKNSECIKREKDIYSSQMAMAETLKENNYSELGETIKGKKVRVVNSIGDYGVNLSMKALAQEGDPVVVIYLGEQIKFNRTMIKSCNFKIKGIDGKQSEKLAILTTALHEFGHCHKNEDPAFERFGEEAKIIIDDAKAEQIYRWVIPQMIEMGAISYDKKQLAMTMLKNSLEWIFDSPENDSYYAAGIYTLNQMFKEKIIEFDFKNGEVEIKDFDAFYRINEELAKKILSLYNDKSMDGKKAKKWIKENCKPNDIVKKVSDFLKKK